MSELGLLEDEHLILDVSPTPNFKKYVAVRAIVAELVFLAMFNVIVAMVLYVVAGGPPIPTVGIGQLLIIYAFSYFVLAAVFITLTLLLTNLMYKNYHYWVTDQRVVWKHGVIGYSITSVPLERISDVTISRTFWERICGVSSLIIKEMGAAPKYYGYPIWIWFRIGVSNNDCSAKPGRNAKANSRINRQKGERKQTQSLRINLSII